MMFQVKKECESLSEKQGSVINTGATYALSKNHTQSVYSEVLDKLRFDFYERWAKIVPSNREGLEEYIFTKTLGTGSFGRVCLVKHKEDNTDVFYAIKVISKKLIMKLQQIEHTLNEKNILLAIRYPFIISMKTCFKDNSYIYFVLPFINGGEMFSHLRRMRRFSEALAKFYAAQVVLALEFFHYCDILYRDLKPENILIDPNGYIKIADLGFCKIVKGRTWTFCGTPEYIAPEIILSKGYGKAVDWWSFGVLMYEINAGFPPFTSSDPMKVYERIIIAKYKLPTAFSSDLQDLIRNLLHVDLSRRFGNLKNGVQDIKTHKWFKGTDWFAIYNGHVEPPFKPTIKSGNDTSNFDAFEVAGHKVSDHELFKEEFKAF